MISVIVPVYNAEKYLNVCIDSILAQTFTNLEIILIDDCSKDNSRAICENYAYQDKRIKFIGLDKNGGQVNAYIEGINCAAGDYIAFVDSDDWIDAEMMQTLHQNICYHNADIAACGCWHVYEDKKIVEPADIESYGMQIIEKEQIHEALCELHTKNNLVDHYIKLYRWNKLFSKRLVLDNLKYLDRGIRVFEDNNFVIPCLIDAKKTVYINKPLYFYRRSEGTTMSLINESVIMSCATFLEHQHNIYQDKKVKHDMFSDALVVNVYGLSKIVLSDMSSKQKKVLLKLLRQSVCEYHTYGFNDEKYRCSRSVRLLLDLLAREMYGVVIFLGSIKKTMDSLH